MAHPTPSGSSPATTPGADAILIAAFALVTVASAVAQLVFHHGIEVAIVGGIELLKEVRRHRSR